MPARESTNWSRVVSGHRESQLEEIGRAAFELVSARGLAHVTMADLAHAVSISRPTLYKYVSSVEAALSFFIERQTTDFYQRLTDAIALANDPSSQLDAYIAVTLRHVSHADHRGALIQLSGGRLSPAVEAVVHAHAQKSQRTLAAILTSGKNAGIIRSDVNVDTCALLIQSMLLGAGQFADDELPAAETTLAMVRSLVWQGVSG